MCTLQRLGLAHIRVHYLYHSQISSERGNNYACHAEVCLQLLQCL